jgi:phospholipid/cholesterol/gamma-HCH transport system permease protein
MASVAGKGFFSVPGNLVLSALTFVGESTIILGDACRRLFNRPFEVRETLHQMAFIGAASVPIVALTAFFSGAVISLYTSEFMIRYGATQFLGGTIGLAVSRELAPVLAGIMVSARCGSAMAAQIGTMAVTEQIDALKMLSVHPTNFLVIPRVVASVLMLPVLAMVGMYAGVLGGWLVGISNGVSGGTFMQSLQQYVEPWDFVGGLIKTPFFGLIVAIVACQQGLRTKEGAVGVGKATTNAVVISMVLVYIANYILAEFLY